MASAFSKTMGNPLCPYFLDEGVKVDVATCLSVPRSPLVSYPNLPGRWFSASVGAIGSCNAVPASLSVAHSVSLIFMGWAVSILLSRRHLLRSSLSSQAYLVCSSAFTFLRSHSPLNLGTNLCDIGIVICIEVHAVALLSVLCLILFSCAIYVMKGKVFSFSLIHSFPCTLFTRAEHHLVRCSQAPERQNIRTNQPFAVGASHHTTVCLSFGCSLSVYGFSLTLSCQSLVITSDSIVLSFFGHTPHLNRSLAYCV